jgi:hypothetical protein
MLHTPGNLHAPYCSMDSTFRQLCELMSYSVPLSLSLNGLEFNIRQTSTQVLRVMQDETNA